ncbi:tetratricopeptide repeat protein [Hamadaea tsunoensis]|uniref:tetratricopeptide repeat protein n=1 Tax=Hamadaea tsunoensis TaxID=53368 RepID=UPI0006864985|nr:tetratricopeptide repeat protein [Hamadaea tsunoensis]
MTRDLRLDRAQELYEDAVFKGEAAAVAEAARDLDALEADLALARGRILHADFLFTRTEDPGELPALERAAELYERLGDERGLAEAEFWIGCFHQVLHQDGVTALPHLERSAELARKVDDRLTLSYAVRHLGFAAQYEAKDPETAQRFLTESVDLRRELEFWPGVAAGLLALGDLLHEQGRAGEAADLLDEATRIATECGAAGTLRWIQETRAEHAASAVKTEPAASSTKDEQA